MTRNASNVDEVAARLDRAERSRIERGRAERQANAARVAAASQLHRFESTGTKSGEGPTVERILKAGSDVTTERFYEAVEVDRGGRLGVNTETVEAQRIRLADAPLHRLFARKLLDNTSAERNLALFMAGERYAELWHESGRDPLKAIDMGSESSGCRAVLMPIGERQAVAMDALHNASAGLTAEQRRVVDDVVLHERDLVDIGRMISLYSQQKDARIVAMHVLRSGLAALATHFRYLA